MTCSLHWKPVVNDSEQAGDIQLREILDKKYGYPSTLDHSDIGYLEALIDADVKGADELVEAIRKHDQIQIFLEC